MRYLYDDLEDLAAHMEQQANDYNERADRVSENTRIGKIARDMKVAECRQAARDYSHFAYLLRQSNLYEGVFVESPQEGIEALERAQEELRRAARELYNHAEILSEGIEQLKEGPTERTSV